MNGKKVKGVIVNPLQELTVALAQMASRPPSALTASSPSISSTGISTRDRPAPIVDRLASISDGDLKKYILSTLQLLKNRSLVASLPDSGLKIRRNLEGAQEEAKKRGFPVQSKNQASSDDVTADPAEGAAVTPLTYQASPSRKILSRAANDQPDITEALKSLNLRASTGAGQEHHPLKHPIPRSHLQKAVALSLNESLKLEEDNEQARRALTEQRTKEELSASEADTPVTSYYSQPSDRSGSGSGAGAVNYRKYQFLQYRDDEESSLSDSDDDDDDVIKEEEEEDKMPDDAE